MLPAIVSDLVSRTALLSRLRVLLQLLRHPVTYPHWGPLIPSRHLWVGPRDPLVHFLRWPWEYRAYLILLCELRRDSSVLELACNHGRTMLGLLDYLCPPGRYEGLDILPRQIEFARREITARFPNFGFTLANVSNPAYGGSGGTDAANYRFPYADGSFDVVYAASLFTHLLPAAAANYLRETRRVLRQGGRALFSFLVLDDYRGPGTTIGEWYRFDHELEDGVAVQRADLAERLIAFGRHRIEDMAQNAGLRILRILPGYWSNTHRAPVNEQDLILFESS